MEGIEDVEQDNDSENPFSNLSVVQFNKLSTSVSLNQAAASKQDEVNIIDRLLDDIQFDAQDLLMLSYELKLELLYLNQRLIDYCLKTDEGSYEMYESFKLLDDSTQLSFINHFLSKVEKYAYIFLSFAMIEVDRSLIRCLIEYALNCKVDRSKINCLNDGEKIKKEAIDIIDGYSS